MNGFSLPYAALEGFRLTRERPGVVAVWWLVYFVFSLGILLIALATAGPALAVVQQANAGEHVNADAYAAAMTRLAPFLSLAVPAEVIFFAVLNCAVYRAILRPEESGYAYFRLGADEVRMAVLAIVLFILWLAAVFFVAMVVGVSAGVLGVVGGPITALLGAGIASAAICSALWGLVRLSLAGPATFQQRRIVIFGSWPLTRGRFWALFLTYLIAFILGVITFILMALVSSALVGLTVVATGGGGDMAKGLTADVSSIQAFLTAPTLLSQLLYAAMMTAFYVINLAPSAIAYQALVAQPHTADAFA